LISCSNPKAEAIDWIAEIKPLVNTYASGSEATWVIRMLVAMTALSAFLISSRR
jgi:hypothetical protein